MDPDFYRNSLSSRYATPDISSLLSEQGLAQVLGPGSAFPTHSPLTTAAAAAARSFGPLPGYAGHALHNASIQDPHLQNIAAQGAYKSLQVGQPPFVTDPYTGLRLTSQSQSNPVASSKSLFTHDQGLPKDIPFSVATSQIPTSIDIAQKAWGLSNFIPQNANPYGHPDLTSADFSALSSQPSLNPPPAHSSKTTHPVQRNPYSGSEIFLTRSTKSPPVQNVYDHRSQASTPVTSQASLYPYTQTNQYTAKSDIPNFPAADVMNYEAVSPATPDHHNQTNETYVSLQDLASISSTQQKLEVANVSHTIQKRPTPIIPDRQNKTHQKQKQMLQQPDMYAGQNGQLPQLIKHSQHQQQPNMGVAGSPQVQINSPQSALPNANLQQAPPTVQAPADSTTKPKKKRSRKKDPANPNPEMKTEPIPQVYTSQSQPFVTSPDMSQRGNGNDYNLANQHVFMQQRNQQQAFSNANLTDTGHSSSPHMSSAMNTPYNKPAQHQDFIKNEPSANLIHPPQMMVGFPQPITTSQSAMSYSVSDALGMSREAVFANHGLMEGYNGADLAAYGMPESFTNQLEMENSMRRNEMYEEGGGYVNNPYGGQFVSPNSVLHMEVQNNQPSTIDENAFSSLMDESYNRENSPQKGFKGPGGDQRPYLPLTVKMEAEQDDDFAHLAKPVSEKKDSNNYSNNNTILRQPKVENTPQVPPPANPKPVVKNASGGTSFMDSFMNFLQGKKPETLSSMSSAIIQNKPQLPKYIPEPPRPKRPAVSPMDSAKHVRKDGLNSFQRRFSDNKNRTLPQNSVITFSDDDDDGGGNSAVQKAISSLGGGDNDKVKFSTNKTGGLTMKINLTKVKRAEEKSRSRNRRSSKSSKRPREQSFGLKQEGNSSEEELSEILPSRQQSSRKAKEIAVKYKLDEDSDSDTLKPIRKPGEASDEEVYDSDEDPGWSPLVERVDKKTPGINAIDFQGKKNRSRKKMIGGKPRVRKSSELNAGIPHKVAKIGEPAVVDLDSGSEEEQLDGIPPITEDLKVGDFVMDKKDMLNLDSYPIWKIESGRMLHKFELFTENAKILHRAIPTFSSWLPSMRNSYVHIRVNPMLKQGDKEYVEVEENCRPKSAIDSKLEEKYEEHPLVEPFNVYLQIFLSQALEPGFLGAIREANERFYLNSLDMIDAAVTSQLSEIDARVKWRDKFKDAIKCRPHIRELDRPNLKQSCQACEFASQPAIKSVHLFGNPYDRFSLQELQPEGTLGSQEFMIGKTAAKFVKPYHSLYHFKYNLYKRCHAKVNILKDGSKTDNATILDQCLQNRAWVLQIFEDLKKLLEKG